jgi:hypothetical protein
MKIEANEFYKTRDGKKAFSGCEIPPAPDGTRSGYRLAGYFLKDGEWLTQVWKADGLQHFGYEGDCDLVEEWREPASEERVVYLVRLNNGMVTTYTYPANEHGPQNTEILGSTRVTVTEGVFA